MHYFEEEKLVFNKEELEEMDRKEEEYQKEKEERKERQQERAIRTREKKKLGQGILIGMCGMLLASAISAEAKLFRGGEKIADEFYNTVLDDADIINGSNGYSITLGSTYVTVDEFASIVHDRAEREGFSDVETYIALSKITNDIVAEKAIGRKPSRSEIVQAKQVHNAKEVIKEAEEETTRGR